MTVVLLELLAAKHAVSSAVDGPDPGMRRPFAPWLEAMVRPGDQVVEESTEKFQVLLADRDEAEAAAFVDACKRAFEEMDPGGELIAAWASRPMTGSMLPCDSPRRALLVAAMAGFGPSRCGSERVG